CCNAADRRQQPSDRPLKSFVQNRHFVRPKVAVPFTLHVNDEVAAHVTDLASDRSRFPTQSECQCALRTWGRRKHQSDQPPSSFPLAESIRQETGRASVSLWGLYESVFNTGVPFRLPLSRLLVKLKAAPTLW